MALPYHLYILVNEGYSVDLAYATAFVLMVILLCIKSKKYSMNLNFRKTALLAGVCRGDG